MANKGLFASAIAKLLPVADTANRELAPAYAYCRSNAMWSM
jgi:60 kDa SS-A/Ro ribonucleoprotein